MTITDTTPFTATVTGLPRIGPDRELKRALEAHWAGRTGIGEVLAVRDGLRRDARRALVDAGLDSVPVGVHSLYDQVLDAIALFGAHAPRHRRGDDGSELTGHAAYFAAARGTTGAPPLEMTKWFDTNYHNLVPEIGPGTEFSLHAGELLEEVREAVAEGVPARPVIIGPFTLLALAKAGEAAGGAAVEGHAAGGAAAGGEAADGYRPLDRLDDVLPLYVELLGLLADAGARWVQIDEPALVQDRTDAERALAAHALEVLGAAERRPAILVATYFQSAGESLGLLADAPVEAVGLDAVAGAAPEALPDGFADKLLVAGVIDGRNVWRADLRRLAAEVPTWTRGAGAVAVSTSCSLLHVPYSLAPEKDLRATDPVLCRRLAFGEEKIAEVAALAALLRHGGGDGDGGVAVGTPVDGAHADPGVAAALEASDAAVAAKEDDPRTEVAEVRRRVGALTDADRTRTPYAERFPRQVEALPLPPLPTTTIGSFPQTPSLRAARADLRAGRIDDAAYAARMREEVESVIRLQEDIGLDVLVHGEPERNDMVQYFAEQLPGYAATEKAWVQSYGSRCVRPPILFGDVSRPEPMTVDWATYAQSLTDRPVKGMLTGPVTMLSWAFVRDDLPIAEVADQVALAIRDEVADLEAAGIRVVQVDEPALRELLPLRAVDQPEYLRWAIGSFRLATAGVRDETSIHTHMCYSEFGELVGTIADLDADVTSIEAARSDMEIVDDLDRSGFGLGVGPGVYDIHSPRVPTVDEMAASLRLAARRIPGERLWTNPDCGLKTRKDEESTPSLRNMVEAAHIVRAELEPAGA